MVLLVELTVVSVRMVPELELEEDFVDFGQATDWARSAEAVLETEALGKAVELTSPC